MKLNVGCGEFKAPEGWVNLDSYPGVEPDVLADVHQLPYEDDSVDAIYCGHLLEHLRFDDVSVVLAEFRRVLVSDGVLCIVGPDYDRALAIDPDPVLLGLIRDGGHRWLGDAHLWLSTAATTLALVRAVFPGVTEVPIKELDHFWPATSLVWWQFALTA